MHIDVPVFHSFPFFFGQNIFPVEDLFKSIIFQRASGGCKITVNRAVTLIAIRHDLCHLGGLLSLNSDRLLLTRILIRSQDIRIITQSISDTFHDLIMCQCFFLIREHLIIDILSQQNYFVIFDIIKTIACIRPQDRNKKMVICDLTGDRAVFSFKSH